VKYLTDLMTVLKGAKDVVTIGGGFIGVEFADEFRKRGLNVTIVELLPHCLQLAYDEEFCEMAERKLTERGVRIITSNRVEEILGDKKVEKVKLSGGETLKADLVLVGIGVAPNIELAKKAGLEIKERGGISVDEYMRTSDQDIFAVGDCSEKISFFTKKPSGLRLASIAAREARIAGVNVFGLKRKNTGMIGNFSTIIGDLGLGIVGLTEKAAKESGLDAVVGVAKAPDKHPGAMPACKSVKIKLVFDKSSKIILGGQVAGGATTAEIANILAPMIEKRITIDEVATLQYGTHPALTCSPVTYQIANAAEDAATKV
jgi:NADPH-dependent 2,4-dienoyl-CoA reductase/sulfur reductase-like enzyme